MEAIICQRDQAPTEMQRAEHQQGAIAQQIVSDLSDALPHASIFVRLIHPHNGAVQQAAKTARWHESSGNLLDEIVAWQESQEPMTDTVLQVGAGDSMNAAAAPIEIETRGGHGFVAAVSCESEFPTPRDRAVLKMAALAAEAALQQAEAIESDELEAVNASEHHDLDRLMMQRSDTPHAAAEALRRSEYMNALGTLAAGLSHDMGNLLLPIRLRLTAIESRLDGEAFAKDLSAIRSCLDSMQRLTRGLALFATDPERPAPTDCDLALHEWWTEVEPFIRNVLPAGVLLIVDLPPALPRVRITRHSLAQALLCVAQNAGEALRCQGQGRVCIWAQPGDDGASVTINIADDGPGMTDEVRSRCFEPFFTTKTRAISTGLGLALVHGIINRANGSVDLNTQPGSGTTVRLTLPTSPQARACVDTGAPMAIVSIDDARLRAFVKSLLESVGFVVDFTDGARFSGAALWATDKGDEACRSAEAFLNGSNRCIVVLDETNHPELREDARIFDLGRSPDRALLSRTLCHCAQRILGPADSETPTAAPLMAQRDRNDTHDRRALR